MHQLRALGQSGLRVAPLAFGGNVFGWTANQAETFRLLDAFVDAGFNLIDTADVYSRWVPGNQGGESESLIGQWLRHSGKREQVVIATKVGMDMGEGRKGLHPDYIRRAVEASLQRLGVDTIDLYQAHVDDAEVPLADTLGAFTDLIAAGKVRAIGASNYGAERLAEALAISESQGLARYETLQPEYNLYARAGYESQLAGVVQAHGLGLIPFYPLAAGFLTGKYRKPEDAGQSARGASVCERYLNPRGLRILDALDAVAERHAATPAQIALAWLLAKGVSAPLSSASSVAQFQQLAQAVTLVLSAEDVAALDAASAEGN